MKMLVNGAWRAGGAGEYQVVNPADEQVVGVSPEASPEDVREAVRAARVAQPTWAQTVPEERAVTLTRIAEGIRAAREQLGPLVSAESGCLARVGDAMVERTAQRFDDYAQELRRLRPITFPAESRSDEHHGSVSFGEVWRRPHGVVAGISPFNFPLIGAANKIAPAIAMGNAIVFKPAPQDPLSVLALGAVFADAGVPNGVVNIVTGSQVETGRALVDDAGIDMVSFTGSTGAGIEIARAGASRMRRHLLELGGKGALIVRADADLDAAVTALARVWTYYSGQWCAAPTRAVLHASVHDEVVERLRLIGRGLVVGDPTDPETDMGPLISAVQRDRVEQMIASAIDAGATEVVEAPARADQGVGFYVPPTLLTNCAPDLPVVQNEVFGPVLSALKFETDEEAVELANGTPFGLTNYVYTRDVARAREIAAQLRSGTVLLNMPSPHGDLPFGGMGISGIGRDNGAFALDAYGELQGVSIAV